MEGNRTPEHRRQLALIVAIVIGLGLGFFIKRLHIGLLIGVVLGLIILALLSKRR